jgi:hypothetical protein
MSMNCGEARRWISMKVDGERIPFSVAGRFEEHLAACGACCDLLSSESRRAVILQGALRSADAARLEASILRGLAAEPGGGARVLVPLPRSRAFLRAAAVFLLAAGGWLAFRSLMPGDSGIAQVILEQEQLTSDVLSRSDGSPMGRGRRQVRRFIFESRGAGGEGGGAVQEPVRLDRARTEYIRLVDYPYW